MNEITIKMQETARELLEKTRSTGFGLGQRRPLVSGLADGCPQAGGSGQIVWATLAFRI
jgi:hypothetical protein